ncbi:hypothetical protein GGR57DRAFT_508943 [Xylariaceae sp. FL1272]|nr:hypothetical protein GGR57DRAFT_508943 [Xylariaceae sp. FL1272]
MPLSRKKSCARCRRSKLRCNLGTPNCSQCAKKRIRCVYDGRDADRVVPYLDHRPSFASTSPVLNPLEPMALGDVDLSQPRQNTVGPLLDFGGDSPFEWDTLSRTSYTLLDMPKSFAIDVPTALYDLDPFTTLEADVEQLARQNPMNIDLTSNSSGPSTGPSDDFRIEPLQDNADMGTLRRRGLLRGCVLTSVALGQLTAFPKMMLEGDSLPPFIQPPCRVDDELALECRIAGRHKCLPETLAISSSLVDMFYLRTPANEDFVWKIIYAEAARLRGHFHKFDRDQQLAATQAVTIYMLLQADDLKSVEKNDVATLLTTGMEFILIMSRTYTWDMSISRVRPPRQEWVFQESFRRILAVFCIIDLLLEGMKTPDGYHCDSNGNAFRMNPLPCQRDIWEARSTRTWMMHYDRYLATLESDKRLDGGDLLDSQLSNASAAAAYKAPTLDLVRWCEGLDMLGTLVWMLIPLHQYRIRGQTVA